MNMDFNLFTPTRLLFGRGKLNELGTQALPGKKALLLISNGKSVKVNGTLDRVMQQLGRADAAYVVCNNIHENPSKEVVMEAAACARENNCDFILALGGGAVLDSAVAVSAQWQPIQAICGTMCMVGRARRSLCNIQDCLS